MSDPVDAEDVRHAAELARVDLQTDDVERYQSDFAEILSYFDRLDDVPDVEPQSERTNVLRPDEVRESLSQDDALDNAEETEDGRFKGPSVS